MDNNNSLDNISEQTANDNTEPCVDTSDATQGACEETVSYEADPSTESCEQQKNDKDEKSKDKSLKILSAIYDYAEIFAISIITVLVLFTFCIRLCRVDGSSMEKTLSHNQMIIAANLFYTPKQDDIIVFHLSNDHYQEPLVKRVIATEGQTVEINLTTGVLKVNGEIMADEHAYLSNGKYDLDITYNRNYIYKTNGNTYFAATVPKGKIFVMGDNRNGSSDSRTSRIGFVDVDTVLGKAVFRISPFTYLD